MNTTPIILSYNDLASYQLLSNRAKTLIENINKRENSLPTLISKLSKDYDDERLPLSPTTKIPRDKDHIQFYGGFGLIRGDDKYILYKRELRKSIDKDDLSFLSGKVADFEYDGFDAIRKSNDPELIALLEAGLIVKTAFNKKDFGTMIAGELASNPDKYLAYSYLYDFVREYGKPKKNRDGTFSPPEPNPTKMKTLLTGSSVSIEALHKLDTELNLGIVDPCFKGGYTYFTDTGYTIKRGLGIDILIDKDWQSGISGNNRKNILEIAERLSEIEKSIETIEVNPDSPLTSIKNLYDTFAPLKEIKEIYDGLSDEYNYSDFAEELGDNGLAIHSKITKTIIDCPEDISDDLAKIKLAKSNEIINKICNNPELGAEINVKYAKKVQISVFGDNIAPENLVLYAKTLTESYANTKDKEKLNNVKNVKKPSGGSMQAP